MHKNVLFKLLVSDVEPLLTQNTIMVAPIFIPGSGISTKIFFGLKLRLRVVTTAAGLAGLPKGTRGVFVSETKNVTTFAAKVLEAMKSSEKVFVPRISGEGNSWSQLFS